MSGYDLKKLDIELGEFILEKVDIFIKKNKILPDIISSHGHTVFHNIKKKISHQIGNPFVVYEKLKIPYVYNFRELDVIARGQGAPLVPFGDKKLFQDYDYCLNIGGIINITNLKLKEIIAYDICPANIVLNYFSRKLDLEFDDKGKMASCGKLRDQLLNKLNDLHYYKIKGPKSLDIK